MPSITELTTMKDMAIDRLNWSRQFALAILGGVADTQLSARAGGKGNHVLWIMGHLASADDQLRAAVSGTAPMLPESFHALFKGGSEPSDNPADYPTRQELLDAMQAARQAVIEWVRSLDDESAFRPVPEPLKPFAPDAITTAFTIAAHELFHLGQVASIRSALGLPPMFR